MIYAGCSMRWVFPWNIMLLFAATGAWAQLPDAPGKVETIRVCKECHEIERAVSRRQDAPGWEATMDKMVALGAKISDQDYTTILDYLVKNYAPEDLPKLNVNKATTIDLESRLLLPRSQAAAVIEYRT